MAIPGKDQSLLIKALFLLGSIRIGMWLFPFRFVKRSLNIFFRPSSPINSEQDSPARVAWAVKVVSRYVPRATCLAQALTVQALLAREGIHSDLTIGVARGETSELEAHAWLEIEGQIIIGGPHPKPYTRLAFSKGVDK